MLLFFFLVISFHYDSKIELMKSDAGSELQKSEL